MQTMCAQLGGRVTLSEHQEFGRAFIETGAVKTDMATVRQRKRDMVDREIALHLQNYKNSGANWIMGAGAFRGSENARSSPE